MEKVRENRKKSNIKYLKRAEYFAFRNFDTAERIKWIEKTAEQQQRRKKTCFINKSVIKGQARALFR